MNFHEAAKDRKAKLQEAQKDLVAKGAEFIHVHVADTNGVFRSKTTPLKLAHNGDAINGILYCVSHSDGMPIGDVSFASPIASDLNGYPNIMGLPDPDSVRHHPWNPRFSSVIMNAFMRDGTPCPLDPRAVVLRQEERARSLGYEPKVALEYEFGIFQADHDLMRAKRYRELTPWGHSYINYDLVRSGDYQDFVAELATRLEGIGVGLASFVTEYGYGMYEAALPPKSPLAAADDAMRFKLHLRELCAERGMVATFMSRFQPPKKESACGAHHHLSLWRDGKSLFAAGPDRITKVAETVSGGCLGPPSGKPSRISSDGELLPAARPERNGRRKTSPGVLKTAWPPFASSPPPNTDATRFEHRVPGADINPYFSVAAILAAGLDGIEQSLPLSAPCPGSSADLGLPPLPRTLTESIELFGVSQFIAAAFGSELQSHYVASREKRKEGLRHMDGQPHNRLRMAALLHRHVTALNFDGNGYGP